MGNQGKLKVGELPMLRFDSAPGHAERKLGDPNSWRFQAKSQSSFFYLMATTCAPCADAWGILQRWNAGSQRRGRESCSLCRLLCELLVAKVTVRVAVDCVCSSSGQLQLALMQLLALG